LSIKTIGLTYAVMNLISPFFSGIPVCHGSGGIAGHYSFGARTGGSVFIYGTLYLVLGLFFSGVFGTVIELFPKPVLGVILFFEGIVLIKWLKDTIAVPSDLMIAVMVGLMAVGLPYGYLIGLVTGTVLNYLSSRKFVQI
jgi:MFS superfamily sulfate permease-like transporter